jgi:hypothetical protein
MCVEKENVKNFLLGEVTYSARVRTSGHIALMLRISCSIFTTPSALASNIPFTRCAHTCDTFQLTEDDIGMLDSASIWHSQDSQNRTVRRG